MEIYKKLNLALSQRISINNFTVSSIWYRFYDEKDYEILKNKDIPLNWIYTHIVDKNPNGNQHIFYAFLNDNAFYKTQECVIAANVEYGEFKLNGYIYVIDKKPTGIHIFYKKNKIFLSIIENKKDEANIEGFYILKILTGIEKRKLSFDLVENLRCKLITQNEIKIDSLEKKYRGYKYNDFNTKSQYSLD
jgi:hypothetical protein